MNIEDELCDWRGLKKIEKKFFNLFFLRFNIKFFFLIRGLYGNCELVGFIWFLYINRKVKLDLIGFYFNCGLIFYLMLFSVDEYLIKLIVKCWNNN